MPRVLSGDNGGVTEKVFFDFDREYQEAKSMMTSAAAKMKSVKKRGADNGIDVPEYEWTRKYRNKTLEQQRTAHNHRVAYMNFWKMPIGAKIAEVDEFSEDVGLSDEDRQKKWENDGYVAAREGKRRDTCPHPDPNSLGARFWMAGYDRGEKQNTMENAKGIKKGAAPKHEPEVEAAKKRGRPKKGASPAEPSKSAEQPSHAGGEVRVTYWNDVVKERVLKISDGSAPPAGAVNLTKAEYEKLEAEYAAKADEEWEGTGAAAGNISTGEERVDPEAEEDEDETPPAAGTTLN